MSMYSGYENEKKSLVSVKRYLSVSQTTPNDNAMMNPMACLKFIYLVFWFSYVLLALRLLLDLQYLASGRIPMIAHTWI